MKRGYFDDDAFDTIDRRRAEGKAIFVAIREVFESIRIHDLGWYPRGHPVLDHLVKIRREATR